MHRFSTFLAAATVDDYDYETKNPSFDAHIRWATYLSSMRQPKMSIIAKCPNMYRFN